jgi:hypothetical protein
MCAPEKSRRGLYGRVCAAASERTATAAIRKTLLGARSEAASARKAPSFVGFSVVMPYHRSAFPGNT